MFRIAYCFILGVWARANDVILKPLVQTRFEIDNDHVSGPLPCSLIWEETR